MCTHTQAHIHTHLYVQYICTYLFYIHTDHTFFFKRLVSNVCVAGAQEDKERVTNEKVISLAQAATAKSVNTHIAYKSIELLAVAA